MGDRSSEGDDGVSGAGFDMTAASNERSHAAPVPDQKT
jgi:hypothetical protein